MKLNDITRGTGLEAHGIHNANLIYWTPPTSVLYEQIVILGEGLISHLGAVAVKTGHFTGRAANEKFIVDEPTCRNNVAWGKVNHPFDSAKFDELYKRMCAYMQGRDLFVQDCLPAPTRITACRSVSLPKKHGILSSPVICSFMQRRRNWKTTPVNSPSSLCRTSTLSPPWTVQTPKPLSSSILPAKWLSLAAPVMPERSKNRFYYS